MSRSKATRPATPPATASSSAGASELSAGTAPLVYSGAMNSPASAAPPQLSMNQVLLCGAVVVTLSMGIRHGFGLWLQPMTQERGWTRESFAFALAVQNLTWGIAGPFTGMLADRFGAFRILVVGGLLYALGLALM